MICSRKPTSESSRLFLAMRMNRVLGANPNPWNRCWVIVALKLELSAGLRLERKLFVVDRVLLKPMKSLIVGKVYRARVLRQAGPGLHSLKNAGGLLAEMIFLERPGDDRIEAVDHRAKASA